MGYARQRVNGRTHDGQRPGEPPTGVEGIVLVVDDDEAVREGLRELLASVGLATRTFPDAREFLGAAPIAEPCCLILDVHLPGLSGLDLQASLADRGYPIPIVFLTGVGDVPTSVRAMKGGAAEFFTKPFDPSELVAAVRLGLERDRAARAGRGELEELRRRHATLTPREREVMTAVVAGLLNKQIAADFGTKEFTVKEQRANVMRKMKVSSLPDLVRVAGKLGDI
jgi:FixJ family two-component response regulator